MPHEQPYWRYVEDMARKTCALYGYGQIVTPVFEPTGLFLRSVGEGTDIVDKQMYTFEDRGGDSMTLRPEGTAPICRAYIQHGMQSLPQPVRLFYIGPIFRYERPQAGRLRQHWQFGAEAIGEADPALDAEVISMAWRLYGSLGLRGLNIQLNSIGCRECRSEYVRVLREYYQGRSESLCPDCRSRIERNPLRLLDCKNPSCREIVEQAPRITEYLCAPCASHFESVKSHLDHLSIAYQLNHYLVRGLDYYTRTVFEVQPEAVGGQSSIGGGGRYDDLIEELGGKPTPAMGFGTGIERIVLNLQGQGIEPPPLPGATVYVAYLGEKAKAEAARLAARLRDAGTGAVLGLGGRSLKAQLKQANALNIAWTLIIGEDELARGTVVLRDMAKGEQTSVLLEEAVHKCSPAG